MAMSESDKKKIPLIIALVLALIGYVVYDFVWVPMQTPARVYHKTVSTQSAEQETSSTSQAVAPPMNIETTEMLDAQGKVVQAITLPDPVSVEGQRSFFLTEEDKRLVDLMRNNVLLEQQIKNESLKQQKEAQKNIAIVQPATTVPVKSNTGMISQSPDIQGFTAVETVQPTLLTTGLSDDEINDAYRQVKVLSISDNGGKISAYVEINGVLTKALTGKRVGDFEIKEVNADYLSIEYVPGNTVRKIGHSGFTYSTEG